MKKRTNVTRLNSNGFGYSMTISLDLLDLNPGIKQDSIQKHFDFMIAQAITDLIAPGKNTAIHVNQSVLDLKCNTIPDYGNILNAVLNCEDIGRVLKVEQN